MKLQKYLEQIQPLDQTAMAQARQNWNSVAKPLGSLGKLEDIITQIAGITGTPFPTLRKKAVVPFCADNGVVAEGVTQSGQEVTAIVARGFARGTTSVCRMAHVAGADVIPVDIGMAQAVEEPNLISRCVRRGTSNLAKEPAMTRQEAEQAVLVGIEMARYCKEKGYHLLAAGEMGIGNTTTSAAVISVLLNVPPEQVTGRGAGLSSEGLFRKIRAISDGISVNCPNPADGLDVLAKVGGFDLAGIVGLYLGGALYQIPVLMDGLIATTAALLAVRLCPAIQPYLIATHQSEEPATDMAMKALGLSPIIHAGMRLGEGTGAVAMMPMLDMALAVYQEAPSFAAIDLEAYTVQT